MKHALSFDSLFTDVKFDMSVISVWNLLVYTDSMIGGKMCFKKFLKCILCDFYTSLILMPFYCKHKQTVTHKFEPILIYMYFNKHSPFCQFFLISDVDVNDIYMLYLFIQWASFEKIINLFDVRCYIGPVGIKLKFAWQLGACTPVPNIFNILVVLELGLVGRWAVFLVLINFMHVIPRTNKSSF